MTREELDSASFDGTITTGTNEKLEVDTSRANNVVILVDDGSTDGTPPQYDMTQRVYITEISDYQFYDKVTSETSRSWIDSAWGNKMEFEFNNTSGSNDTYRITIKSYRGMD